MAPHIHSTVTRRGLFALGAGAAAFAVVPGAEAPAQPVATRARIVIIGAGAAGTALANRLAQRLDGATITIVDGSQQHWYQPGFTLIAAGLKPAEYSVSRTTDWLPAAASLVADHAAQI